MCRRRKKPGTVANQPMRALPVGMTKPLHREGREGKNPGRSSGQAPEKRGGTRT